MKYFQINNKRHQHHISHLILRCTPYFPPCSSVSTVNFEHVIVGNCLVYKISATMRSWECRTQRMFNNLTKQNQKPGFLFCSEPGSYSVLSGVSKSPASRVQCSASRFLHPESSLQSQVFRVQSPAYRVQSPYSSVQHLPTESRNSGMHISLLRRVEIFFYT